MGLAGSASPYEMRGRRNRIITQINYGSRMVSVRLLGTHVEHDKVNAREV